MLKFENIDMELAIRYNAVSEVSAMGAELLTSLKFFICKFRQSTLCGQEEISSLKSLLQFLLNEMQCFLAKLEVLKSMQSHSLLSSGKLCSEEELNSYLEDSFLTPLKDIYSKHQDWTIVKELLESAQKIQSIDIQPRLITGETEIISQFQNMLLRYSREHEEDTQMYLDDVFSPQIALDTLKAEYRNKPMVELWFYTHRNIPATILNARKQNLQETDLLPLFRYIVCYQAIVEKVNSISRAELESTTCRKAFYFGRGAQTTIYANK